MKKTYKLLPLFIVALVFSSCVSTNKMSNSAPVQDPGRVVHQALEADVTVDDSKKISGSSASTYFLMFRIKGDSEYADGINYSAPAADASSILSLLNPFNLLMAPIKLINRAFTGDAEGKVKSAAAYQALQATDADFIAHPAYVYTRKNYFIIQKFEATVTGYPGTYSNFRSYDTAKRYFDYNIEHQVNKKIVDKLVIGDGLEK